VQELRGLSGDGSRDLSREIDKLAAKSRELTRELYRTLTPWEVAKVARHPQRPYTQDYIDALFTDFHELRGDRAFADDPAIVGGIGRIALPSGPTSVMVIGHQKGRDVKERTYRNFGMPRPEGYRKALRLMRLAEKFNMPVVTLVDTAGAYPGIGAEERGQSEAIGRNLFAMAQLKVPIVTAIIGEGGSGGALAIAMGDQVFMLQFATYSVISPEGCASILWKSASHAPTAAATLGITADRLKPLGLIDEIVPEPEGGAHRDWAGMFANLRPALVGALTQLGAMSPEALAERRAARLDAYGKFAVVA
jgi:acetyl-CoA carboxylase carboxyl transferase subunit alpha